MSLIYHTASFSVYCLVIMEYFSNKSLSCCNNSNIRLATPDGLFVPVSHASTVLGDTPIASANSFCVILCRVRISFISVFVYVFSGEIVTLRTLTFGKFPFSYSIASNIPCFILSKNSFNIIHPFRFAFKRREIYKRSCHSFSPL